MLRLRQRWTRNDSGVTLVELMVVMIVMGLLAGVIISAITWANRTTTTQTRNAELWADMQDASTQLARDVNDASLLTVADANSLTVEVIRDDKCQIRAWVADVAIKRLTVTTTFFDQAACSGGSTTREDRIVGNNAIGTNASGTHPTRYLSPVTFAYFDDTSTVPLATPSEASRVSRISWTLVAEADADYRDEKLTAGAAFEARPESDPPIDTLGDPLKPLLCASLATPVAPACGPVPAAASGKFEGVHDPVLQWVDPTPTLTQSWTVWRIANPEGMSATDPARTTWAWLGVTAAGQTWYSDTTLPDGYTAQYVVRATVATGVGPESNQVITGNRPATTVTRAAGAQTQIAVDWNTVVGATGYDVYRDQVLVKSVTAGSTLAWVDKPGESGWTGIGYGHSHYYRVVPVNRWENRLAVPGNDAGRLTLGTALGNYLVGGARSASPQNAASGDFTAPNTPGHSVTANADRTNTNAWSSAAWIGSGPTAGREASWLLEHRSSNEGVTTLMNAPVATHTHASRPAGRWSEYRVYGRNASGDGPPSAFTRVWQRPATPTCSGSSPSTRSMVVNGGSPATVDESYTGTNVEVRVGGGGWVANGTNIDPLSHGTVHTFHSRVLGTGGWSDEGACTANTLTLGVAITSLTSTTRSVSASMATANGSASTTLTLNNVRTDYDVVSSTWDPLTDGSAFTVTAANSDGYNTVSVTSPISTQTLATPAVPTCSSWSDDSYVSTTVHWSSNGSLSRSSVWATSAGYYSATATATNSDGWNTKTATSSCGTTVWNPPIPGAPGPGNASGGYTVTAAGVGGNTYAGVGGITLNIFNPVAGATKYEGYAIVYGASTGLPHQQTTRTLNSSSGYLGLGSCLNFGDEASAQVRVFVRAGNAYGWSGWYQFYALQAAGGASCA